MSDIRDWAAQIRGRWDWTRFGYEKGFPRGSQFGDVDAFIHLDFEDRSLYIDPKQYDGVGVLPGISTGQSRALKHLATLPGTTALVLFGCGVCDDPWCVRDMGTDEFHDWRGMEKAVRRKNLKTLFDWSLGLEGNHASSLNPRGYRDAV